MLTHVKKKDKMDSCGAPRCTNRADKNSNKITLVTTMIILPKLYRAIFTTLAYLMPETYSKPCEISKMMRHIENPGIIKTVYSDIVRSIQGHSAILSHVLAYCRILRHTESYSSIIKAYWVISRNIQNSKYPLHIQQYHIQNSDTIRTQDILKSLLSM